MQKNDPTKLYICPKCKAFFATKDFLEEHMKRKCIRTRNTTNQPFPCPHCTESFRIKCQLTHHLLLHTGERPFKCVDCDKMFLTKSHLKRHSVVHMTKDQLAHACDECDKKFAWPSELKAHYKTHTGEKPFKCGICGKMFLYLMSLKGHMTNRHTFNGKFICVVCKASFEEATGLIIHMKTHSEDQSLKCERCYALFTSLRDLETHICTNFGGNPLVCVSCISEFESTQEYCKHNCMQVNFNRKCGCCLKVFKNLWHLREHLITHTGEKPYSCLQCKSGFRRKRELEIHMTRHGDEKPFECQHCQQKFTSDTYLKQHQRKEHRAKKFVCHVCNHSFMHRCTLNNHVRYHEKTGNKKYGKKYHRNDYSLENKDNREENSNRDCTPLIPVLSVIPDSKPVIEPKIAVPNAEQAPTNTTTIFDKQIGGNLVLRCASCFQQFESHSDLLRHRKESHSDGKPYQCDLCFRTFSVAANLSQHKSVHSVPQKYTCTKCGKGYKVTHKLRDHLKTKHGEDTNAVTDLELQLGTVTAPETGTTSFDRDISSPSLDLTAWEFMNKLSEPLPQDISKVLDKTIGSCLDSPSEDIQSEVAFFMNFSQLEN